jgi:hypothetical protein
MSQTHTSSVHPGASEGGKAPLLQRKCACGQHTSGGGECEECRKKRTGTLRRSAVRSSEIEEAPPIVHEVLRSPGQPLDASAREALEPRFGRDFSQVRVHADGRAAESARAVDALGYTVGPRIVFAGGRYEPGRGEGLELLAHELTHVVQQEGRDTSGPLRVGPANDAFEQEADRMAEGAVPLHFGSAAAGVQRRASFGDRAAEQVDFEGCDPQLSQEIRSTIRPAIEHLDRAIAALAPGWSPPVVQDLPAARFERDFSRVPLRACGSRVLQRKPATSTQKKIQACEELLKGAVTRREEMRILDILRSSSAEERREIVEKIGRDRLWKGFNLRRRKSVEVLTRDLDEFKDLEGWKIDEYSEGALPEEREDMKTIKGLQGISTPLPIQGTKLVGAGEAELWVNGIQVRMKPDRTDPSLSQSGETTIEIDPGKHGIDKNGKLIPPRPAVTLQTLFAPDITPKFAPSDYGRGAAKEDVTAGKTSLRFHEGDHGRVLLEALADPQLPFPAFRGQSGMSQQDLAAAQAEYEDEVNAYEERLRARSVQEVDCAGDKPKGSCVDFKVVPARNAPVPLSPVHDWLQENSPSPMP